MLSAPEREGREALFGLRQVVEFLAARYLLKDGWPPTQAEALVAKYRGKSGAVAAPRPAAQQSMWSETPRPRA